MGKYSLIKKAFAFLEAEYGFSEFMRQKHGSYYYIACTNDKKDIMVLYDDTVDDKRESPVRIRIYDADCFGTAYDDVAEFRNEFITLTGTPKDRIVCAAEWLRTAIASGGCDIGRRV